MKVIASFAALCCVLGYGCGPTARDRPNVLLVVVDTLRADRLGYAGSTGEITPNLDRLAADSLVFPWAQSPRAKTTPAVASLMTGLYPHEHGIRDLSTPLDASIPTLAEAFREAGYKTAAIVGNYVLQKRWSGLARGFDQWVEDLPHTAGVPPDDVPERLGESLTDGALALFGLREAAAGSGSEEPALGGRDPWFLYLHYMDPHGFYNAPGQQPFKSNTADPVPAAEELPPHAIWKRNVAEYNVPPDSRLADGRADANAVRNRYDAEVRYVDSQIGRLLGVLEQEGLLENTIILVTADHGESLGEHRYWFEHGRYAYEVTCRVPLLLSVPGLAPRTCEEDISLCDLAPTLVDLCNLSPFPHPVNPVPGAPRGRSRFAVIGGDDSASREHPVFSEKIAGDEHRQTVQIKAVRIGHWKLIRRYAHRKARSAELPESSRGMLILSEELYDLRSDPGETRNLVGKEPTQAPLDRLKSELDLFLSAEVRFAELSDDLAKRREQLLQDDPERERNLRALGY